MRRSLVLLGLVSALAAVPASAQSEKDLARFEWVGGLLMHGSMADVAFQLDTTPFGGILIERSGGSLDVDPAFSFGLRTSYRLSPRTELLASWMHAEGRYRVLFPALAQDQGDFDLEALLLSIFDFAGPELDVSSAAALSKTDVYALTARYEFPILEGRMRPFLSGGAGIYRERSDGPVFHLDFAGELPASVQILQRTGSDLMEAVGVSRFSVDATDPVVSVGGGMRASIGKRWGVQFEAEDLVRLSADLSSIDDSSTPPADALSGRVMSTTFQGTKGVIHNPSVRIALDYAFWPWGAPR